MNFNDYENLIMFTAYKLCTIPPPLSFASYIGIYFALLHIYSRTIYHLIHVYCLFFIGICFIHDLIAIML